MPFLSIHIATVEWMEAQDLPSALNPEPRITATSYAFLTNKGNRRNRPTSAAREEISTISAFPSSPVLEFWIALAD
jgi:hypothetical protein